MKTIITFFLSLILGINVLSSGTVKSRTIMVDGQQRSYILFIPSIYTGAEQIPLVIDFHGFNSNTTDQMTLVSSYNSIADTAGFMVVYPQGLNVRNNTSAGAQLSKEGSGWVIPGFFEALQNQDDIEFTKRLLDTLNSEFNLDPERIFTSGWSNGSMMAMQTAYELPDKIASVACVAAGLTYSMIDSIDIDRPLSVLYMHGTADPVVDFNGIDNVGLSAQATVSFWTRFNGCTTDSVVTELPDINTADNSTVRLIEYTDCNPQTEVLFYIIENGGHPWPGSGTDWDVLGNNNMDISASKEIWNFFKRNPMPDNIVNIIEGDTLLSSQAEVDAFHANYVTGNLTISGDDIVDLTPLSTLNFIGGDLEIIGNDLLPNLDGLGNVSAVGSSIKIGGFSLGVEDYSNPSLINIDGLNNIKTVNGDLHISANVMLTNLNGLNNIEIVSGSVIIQFNKVLLNLDGLSNLTTLDGDIMITRNLSLNNFCGLYNLLNSNGLKGNYKASGNLINPTQQEIINAGPCDTTSSLNEILSSRGKFLQNHPNPFHTTTTIQYQLPVSGNVKITIYDIFGKEVTVLVNEQQMVGDYEVEWNAEGLPAGIYFYRLEVDGQSVQTRKMILNR